MRESQVRNMPDMPTQMWAVYEEMKQRRERGGWRAVGRLMKVSGAYARQLARGEKPITPTLARAWLEGTQQITQTAIAPVCPDCGNVHTGRCHGKPVAAVVCLAPDEQCDPLPSAGAAVQLWGSAGCTQKCGPRTTPGATVRHGTST